MPFIDDARTGGRKQLTIVELNLDNKLHPSGIEQHCNNEVPWGQRFFATVKSVDFAPTRIQSFEGLSYVGQVTIDLSDFEYGAGDYFARLTAMNPFYFNRECYVYTGYIHNGFNINNFKRRLYFIKKMDYDWEKRSLKITAKDPLSMIDERGLTIPPEIRGGLLGPIPAAVSALSPPYNTYIPAEIYNAGIDGDWTIGNEMVWIHSGGTVIVRGMHGTRAQDHNTDAVMRKAIVWVGVNPINALRDALTAYAGLGSYIDNAEWDSVRDTYTTGDEMNGALTTPKSIKDFTKKVCEQFGLNIWFDDENQKLKIQAIGWTINTIKQINWQQHIINKGHRFNKDIQKAVTQTWYYYNKIDPTKGDDSENYGNLYIYFDGALEGNSGHRTAIIKKVYADFVGATGLGIALKIASRIMARYREGYQEMTFQLDAKDSDLNVGDVAEITTKIVQDANGVPLPKNFEIVEKDQITDNIWSYRAVFGGATKSARLIAPNTMGNYSGESEENRNKYAFIDVGHLIV